MNEPLHDPAAATPSASQARAFELLSELTQRWHDPVLEALFADDVKLARERLTVAQEALTITDLPEDIREALRVSLTFLDFRIRWQPPNEDWTPACYQKAKHLFSEPARGWLANYERIQRLLTMRFHADMDQYDELTGAEINAYLAELPVQLEDSRIWHQIAGWAFIHGEVELLGQAFGSLTIHPQSTLGQARWQRVNLMYQLLKGKASRRDVTQTIGTLQLKPQLLEFEGQIWPECVKAGLVDAELEQQLAERAALINSEETILRPERKTKSIRNS